MRALGGILAGVVASALVLRLCAPHGHTHTRPVAEDASAPLSRIAIHYAPSADQVALTTWRQLFAVLPPSVEVDVEVARQAAFDRFTYLIAADGRPRRRRPLALRDLASALPPRPESRRHRVRRR